MNASFFNNQEFGERNKNAEYLSRKKRPVAWFVSNCDTPSNRMEYVKGMLYQRSRLNGADITWHTCLTLQMITYKQQMN
jgi:hypothetical protein